VPRAKKVTGMKTCPVPTAVFTGQKDKIEQVTTCITRGDKERCVFILHGLGGAGKTQIALKTIEKTSDMWTDIIFVDATSRETTTSALEGFAKDKKIGETHNDAIRWLGDHKERWLMLFDNADDPSLGISRFFPQGGHGSILVTTRVPGLALLGRGLKSDCRVSDMVPEEALELLLKAARLEGEVLLEAERNAAVQLLQVRLYFQFIFAMQALSNTLFHRTSDTWRWPLSMRAHIYGARNARYTSIERFSSNSVEKP
jgi:hypothetical protein